jgi:hypothetical protein
LSHATDLSSGFLASHAFSTSTFGGESLLLAVEVGVKMRLRWGRDGFEPSAVGTATAE